MKEWRLLPLRLGLGLCSGLLYGLPFRFPALGILGFFALVPWIILCTHPKLRERSVLLSAFVGSGLIYYLAWSWLFGLTAAVGWTIFVVVLFVPYSPFVLALRRCYRLRPLPLTFLVPVLWVGWEMLFKFLMPAEASLMRLGYSQACFIQLVQIADLFGVAGVSFLVAMANGLIADLLYFLVPRLGVSRPGRARALIAGGAFTLTFLATGLYGIVQYRDDTFRPGPKLALIQPAVPHLREPGSAKAASRVQAGYTVAKVKPGVADLIIWPENAILDRLDADPQYMIDIQAVLRLTRTDLLLSAFRTVPEEPERAYNSVFHFNPAGEQVGVYDKIHLLPVAEYLPLDGLARRLGPSVRQRYLEFGAKFMGFVADSLPSRQGMVVFTLETRNGRWVFGAPTCYENTKPRFARQAVRMGAEFIVNMTSEGALGPLASQELYMFSVFRAIEYRVGIARVGNIGITGFIDPNGNPQNILADERGPLFHTDGVLIDHVTLDSRAGKTLYTKLGDWPAYGLSLLAAIFLLAPRGTRRAAGARRRDDEAEREEVAAIE